MKLGHTNNQIQDSLRNLGYAKSMRYFNYVPRKNQFCPLENRNESEEPVNSRDLFISFFVFHLANRTFLSIVKSRKCKELEMDLYHEQNKIKSSCMMNTGTKNPPVVDAVCIL